MRTIIRVWDSIHPDMQHDALSTPTSRAAAFDAVADAQGSLDRARGNKPSILEKVAALKSQRDRNHFAELIEVTMRGNG